MEIESHPRSEPCAIREPHDASEPRSEREPALWSEPFNAIEPTVKSEPHNEEHMKEDLILEPVKRLSKDLASASKTLSEDEARYLVDAYYMMQADRIRSDAQVRSLVQGQEPHDVLRWLAEQSDTLENQIKRALQKYADSTELGNWCQSIIGIGPVLTAGLMAHIDIEKAPTVGHIWRYAGLDPTVTWEKGQKRPWNATLKTLCWKIGESFVKVSGNDDSFYGKLYSERKKRETDKNEAGDFAAQAKLALEKKKYKADTKAKACYESGKLPPAHIHARAKRYTVKMFLSHYHEKAWGFKYPGIPIPKPYAISILGHAHYIPVPKS